MPFMVTRSKKHVNAWGKEAGEKNGGGAGTRTPDTGIMIPLLYQLSYTAPGKN